jgi:hypothetical protein
MKTIRTISTSIECPLYPQKRTFLSTVSMSALGQKQTHALQQIIGGLG